MRILAIGDIHGYRAALDALLDAVRPTSADCLIFLGDYVDRGPDSRGVLDRVIELERKLRVVALRGNHEQMMMESRGGPGLLPTWLFNGGEAALASYAQPGREGTLADVPTGHWSFLDHVCVDWFETDDFFFVHGGVVPNVPIAQQPPQVLRWQKLTAAVKPHYSGKTMICGHTPQSTKLPLDLGFAICIDTGIYMDGGKLTCLDVEAGDFWQADQQGAVTTGHLDDLEDEF